ncbi:MAG: cadherin-like beta sandwich domain-containing protein [Verrucomicrobiota bacterium]
MKTTFLLLSLLCLLPSAHIASATPPPYVLRHSMPAPADLQTGGTLGYSSAFDGNRIVLGAPGDDTGATDSGVVRIFDATTGAQTLLLTDPDAEGTDQFGQVLLLSGNRLIVSARRDKVSNIAAGSVYVYDLGGATPATPVLSIPSPVLVDLELFGSSLSLSGNRLAVGAPNHDTGGMSSGRVYVFDLAGATPAVPVFTINNPTPAISDQFGLSASLDGDKLVVGTYGDDTGATDAGIAYVFDLASATPEMPVLTLNNPDAQANDFFGEHVQISGSRIVVGAYGSPVGGFNGAGSAYVYDLNSGTPTMPVHTLDNPSPNTNEYFGGAFAFAGDRLLVSASRNSVGVIAVAGSTYVYDLAGGTPTVPVQTLNNPAPFLGDSFGYSVAFLGNRILIGAAFDDAAAPNAGTGYLFDLASGTPTTPVLTLNQVSPAAENHSGQAVAVSGALVAVGAGDDDLTAGNAGTVVIYDMSSATPTQPWLTINSPNPAVGSMFGNALAMEGTRLVVGAQADSTAGSNTGSVFVFDLAGATPATPVLVIPNPTPSNSDYFGRSVSLSGNRLAIGAYMDDVGATDAGVAYVYDLSSGTPATPVHTLTNPSPNASDYFGFSIGISGNRVIVGAYRDDVGASDAGIAYAYDLSSGTPTVPTATLNNPTPAGNDYYGYALTISGDRAVVGAYGDAGMGTAYVYDLAGATPATSILTLNHPHPAGADGFAQSLSLHASRLVVGVPGNDTGANSAGRAYAYDLTSATPTVPIAMLVNPSPGTFDFFGNAVGVHGTRIVVGVPNSDLGGRDQGAAHVFEPPSTNANLASLTLSAGTLSPAFDAGTLEYSTSLPAGTSSMTITPAKTQLGATITVNGSVVTSGNASASLPLSIGTNTITVVVTAEDETTLKTYTLTVTVAGGGTLAFASTVYTVTSNAAGGTADIVINRSGNTIGPISCTLNSSDGSATAPAHYTMQNGTAVNVADSSSEAHVMIPIAAGATTTTAKVFTLTLADPGAGVSIGSPSTATVVILPPASAAEAVKPAATITTPTNNAIIVDTLPVAITGTATDNIGVAKVQVSVNNGVTYTDATLASLGGTSTSWTVNMTPMNGPNAVKVRALDFKGNVSAPTTRSFTHLRTLTVGVSGPVNSGGVDAGFMPSSPRQSGKSYSITAKAMAGHVFDGWTVNNMAGTGITPASAELPKLTFIMQPGLTLTAKFIINPFKSAVTGDFSGLILASGAQPAGGTVMSHATTGLCTAKLTTTGVLSGNVKFDGLSLPFTAQSDNAGIARFGANRSTTLTLVRPGKLPLLLALQADLTGATKTITGTLTEVYRGDITAEFNITAPRHAYDGKAASVPASYVKSYTGRLKARASQGAGFNEHDYPAGDGFITFKVQANGLVSMAGRLADDTPVTFSGNLSQANHWPLYQSLYSNKGCIAADASLDEAQTDSDATALNMLWFRPYQLTQWYPYGWSEGIFVDMLASKYTPAPAAVFTGLGAVNADTGNTDLIFTSGLLSSGITKFVNLTPDNKTSNAPLGDKTFSLKLAPASGLISGDLTDADSRKLKWQGVLLQKGTNKGGHGYFMSFKPAVPNYLGESGKVSWQAK